LIVKYETNTNAGGDCGKGLMGPARGFLILRELMALAASESPPPLPDRDHYREMAGRVRELARLSRSPAMRKELADLAGRYDRRGDHVDRRAARGR
jgi:hypothetical protein